MHFERLALAMAGLFLGYRQRGERQMSNLSPRLTLGALAKA
jgi:hypothetical protein